MPRARHPAVQQEATIAHRAPTVAVPQSAPQAQKGPARAALQLRAPNAAADVAPTAGQTIELLTEFRGSNTTNWTPPDTQMAAGPSRLIEMVNVEGKIFEKSGSQIGTAFDLRPFFDPTSASALPRVSDPKVLYDAESGRFFASIFFFDKCDPRPPPTGNGCTTFYNSEVYLAVSQTSDPGGAWWVYLIQSDTNHVLYDQPKIGVSSDKVLMSWNGYSLVTKPAPQPNDESYTGSFEVVVQKSTLLSGATTPLISYGPNNSRFNVMPAQSLSATTTAYGVYHNGGSSSVSVLAYTGTPANNNVAVTKTDLGVGTFTGPPAAEQPNKPNGTWTLETGDDRLQTAVWKGNHLWTAGTSECVPGAGDNAKRACIRFIDIATSGGLSVAQNTNLHLVNGYLFFPAVTLDRSGNLWAGFTASSSARYATATVGVVPGAQFPPEIGGVYYAQGSAPYCDSVDASNNCTNGKRWGDYSAAVVDPANPADIWVDQEYGSTSTTNSGRWATGIGRFTLAGPTVSSISPSSGPERSVCVITVRVSGTDFVPGGTSVHFGAAAATSVTVSSPEQLTARAPAQPAGTVDVTVSTANGASPVTPAGRFSYIADTVAPATTATLSPLPNAAGWNKSGLTVTLNATDNVCGTGVQSITYSASGAQPIASTTSNGSSATIGISTDGVTTISYAARDIAGNVETARTLIVRIDTAPPQSALAIGLPQYASGPPPVIPSITPLTLTATDAGSGVQSVAYRFFPRGGPAPAYTTQVGAAAQFTLDGPDGIYEVDTFATDVAGNAETPHTQLIRLSNTRVLNGLQALYTFEEGSGATAHDVSGVDTPLNLSIGDPAAVRWVSGGLVITSPTVLVSGGPATKLTSTISATGEVTIEAWVRGARTSPGASGSIVSIAASANNRDLTLAQTTDSPAGARHVEARLRASTTTPAGKTLRTPNGSLAAELAHVVYTRDALGATRLYINGDERAKRTVAGDLTTWDQSFRLALANELAGDHPWLGEFQLIAVYNRALSPAEVRQNLVAGSSGDAARLADGVQALYSFEEGSGTTVHDVSGAGVPLDLEASDPSALQWTPSGLVISSTTVLSTTLPATRLTDAISTSSALTLEAWVVPVGDAQPRTLARIATLSTDDSRRNVELLQERQAGRTPSHYTARLRTSATSQGGDSLETPNGSARPVLQHLAFTRDASGQARLYIDGVAQAHTTIAGDLSTWDAGYRLALANSLLGDRPWLGEFQLVAVYDRALDPLEVAQNFHAGPAGDRLPPAAPRLQARYSFEEGSGAVVHDTAAVSTPLDLQIGDASAVRWVPGGLVVAAPTALTSASAAAKLIEASSATGEVTIEAWVAPATTAQGTGTGARIVALSTGLSERNIMLVQERGGGGRYSARLRTTVTGVDGDAMRSDHGALAAALQHVVYTRDALGIARLYVDGVVRSERTIGGDLGNWDAAARLVLANELSGDQPWLGEYQLAAFYNRALSPAEVVRHFNAGPGAVAKLH
ncbi:MAG: LamG-like jellyroll fold domain-containing protein [Roseiflexaceae bacterium]